MPAPSFGVKAINLLNRFDLFEPSQKIMRCCMSLFFGVSSFDLVQDLIALIDPGTRLLFPNKDQRVFEMPYNPAILEVQFRREIELGHTAVTVGRGECSNGVRRGWPRASACLMK